MALNIRNRQTDALAGKLARLTGEIKTDAVTKALCERLMRVSLEKHPRGSRRRAVVPACRRDPRLRRERAADLMVIETSALSAIEQADARRLSIAGFVEASIVLARVGKGRLPAGLNFGDCFACGVAKELDQSLLRV